MRRLLTPSLVVLALALWVLAGPIAMAFDGCAMMGAMCEAPCGVSSYIVAPTLPAGAVLQPLAYLSPHPTHDPTAIVVGPLTPPPKASLLSA